MSLMPPPLGKIAVPREPKSNVRDLLAEVTGAIWDAPIREGILPHTDLLIFGSHDARDGAITLNVPLLRALVFLHEGLHRIRPRFSESWVRSKSRQLAHALSDAEIADLDATLLAAIRASR